jgi:hypothetical protein
MRTYIIAAAMMVVMSANAQVEMSDMEFAPVSENIKYNYHHELRHKGAHRDEIKKFEGNNLEPTIYYDVDNHGWFFDFHGDVGTFANNMTYGGGASFGYEGRVWTADVREVIRRAVEDAESDRQNAFLQFQTELRISGKILQWNNHHSGIKLGAAYTFQLSSFLDQDKSTWTGKETTPDGVTTTTTKTTSDLDIREFTSGMYGFVEFFHNFKFSPISIFAGAHYGVQQNIVLNTNKVFGQGGVYAGVRIRIMRHASYNTQAMEARGYTKADVWNMRSEMRPYQMPMNK